MATFRERGSALLTVLWMSAALATIGISVSMSVRTETDHVSTASEGLRAHYLATGSVERAIQWMTWGSRSRNPDGSPRWRPNTPRLTMNYPSGTAVVEMIPESSKLSINRGSQEDLLRVAAFVTGDAGLARQIVAGILEWRAGAGGTPPSFSFAGPTFQPRGASFEEIEELLFVRGVTPEIFYGNFVADAEGRLYPRGGLRDALSVWGSTTVFDANTASPAILEMVGLAPPQVQALIARRTVRPLESANEAGVAASRLRLGGNLVWTLRATARMNRPDGSPSDVVRSSAAVVKYFTDQSHSQAPVHVMRFYDDAWSQFALTPPAPAVTQ